MHPPPDPRRNESRYPSRWVAAHQRTVIGAALLLTLLALPFAAGLHIESDLVSLLPEGSPAADDYRTFLDRFGGFEKVFVMVLADPDPGSPPSGLLLETAQELAARLRTLPGVARVRTGSEPEDEAFFVHHVVRRAPLLLPDDALPAIAERLRPEAIRERAATLRARLRTPSGSAMAELLTHDPLGFAEDLPLLAAGQHLPVDPVTSAFLSPAGDAALLILDPASGEMDAEAGRQLLADLQRTFEELHRDLTTPRTEDAEDAWHLTDDGSEGTRHQAEDRVVGAAEGAWHRGDDAGGGGTEGAWHQSERHQSESAAEGAWHRVRSERIEPGAGLRFLALGGPLYAAQDEAML
ncbi:MAG: hypothetical protein MI919_29465, partial [Holophagales bacterium]|nr:hypothetical protein [Holophagales bacterium]